MANAGYIEVKALNLFVATHENAFMLLALFSALVTLWHALAVIRGETPWEELAAYRLVGLHLCSIIFIYITITVLMVWPSKSWILLLLFFLSRFAFDKINVMYYKKIEDVSIVVISVISFLYVTILTVSIVLGYLG